MYEINVFKYSVREGTVAQRMENQVPEEIKGERSDCLLELTRKQKQEYEDRMKDYEDEILVEEVVTDERILEQLPEVVPIDGNKSFNQVSENQAYYTGHTKRYVKGKILAGEEIVNRILRAKFV